MSNDKFRFSIDRGGTFTDIYAEIPGEKGNHVVYKLLSVDPHYADAPTEGIRRIMEKSLGVAIPTSKDIDTSRIEWIRMGTTVATNALLERTGEPCVLVTTKGFRDLLQIGNQSRPQIFDLEIKKPELLHKMVIEVDERVRLLSKDESKAILAQQQQQQQQQPNSTNSSSRIQRGVSGEFVEVIQSPDYDSVREQLRIAREVNGFKSVAVLLIHSYTFHEHEKRIGQIAEALGFEQVSLSCTTMPMIRAVPRGYTTCVDAYLTPHIRRYLKTFSGGFRDNLKDVNVTFMQSDGGLTPSDSFTGCRAILSGPAGGVVGYASLYEKLGKKPLIGFDMGGTSTDVSRFDGTFEHIYETKIAGVTIQAPQLDIHTVAAGGGSRLFFKAGMFIVGPESSGAHPGPICYRKNGYLSVTDANLMLGRIVPEYFPHIFGPSEDMPLSYDDTRAAFVELTKEINEYLLAQYQDQIANSTAGASVPPPPQELTPEAVAFGFLRVANEAMCRPIRAMTVAKGYDTRDHVLACFGGAGPQHACAIAAALGMREVYVHRYSGILSAFGLGMADVVHDEQEPCSLVFEASNFEYFATRFAALREKTREELIAHGFQPEDITLQPYLNLRYKGTDYSIMTTLNDAADYHNTEKISDYGELFEKKYLREYGFTIPDRPIIVDDIRIRGYGKTNTINRAKLKTDGESAITPLTRKQVYFEGGFADTPIYDLGSLPAQTVIEGPAVIIHNTSTIVVIPNATATITDEGDVRIVLHEFERPRISTELDSVQLSIFAHRFMSIAEQMGNTLQRTSISTNIKERLDFSCALFGPDGGLVANAPHLPVHLGSMSEAVKWQIKHLGDNWKEGEVLVANHPAAGGSHLPDITVITPVYQSGKPVFYVASRGHHADIGGLTPGSMPPFSRLLSEEGAAIKSFKLVENGRFQTEGISRILLDAGTRCLQDNIADLQAQVAANQKGISLVNELINHYGLEVVQAYMLHVQDNASLAVSLMLAKLVEQHKTSVLQAEDFMDDGSRIRLKITIDFDPTKPEKTTAVFDFEGTSPMVMGNTNAPVAVTVSAILYCLRCLINIGDVPLNQGCLEPITIHIPKKSILSPADTAGVVGGNVLTSQRVTDVILRAFRAAAASQGCMNNFTFGSDQFGYYETIAGGAGAGPTWHGQSGVHTHMTNTRITDVEIMERRYPVLVREFSIRQNSGGAGKFRGGDGVIRDIQFLQPLKVGILSERRVFAPFGLNGGGDGERGLNLLIKQRNVSDSDVCELNDDTGDNVDVFNLGPRNAFTVDKGDRVRLLTPGAGGFGALE